MSKEWITGNDGHNLKFKREYLLNSAMNRWGLNKAHSVGPTSELIRKCGPKNLEDWEKFYFDNAHQKKKDGLKIDKAYITELGRKLYVKLTEVIQNEIESITEEECIDYVYNLVLHRTFEGYMSEIHTIYGQLQEILGCKIEPAPDEWDRLYNVDFYIQVNGSYIGLQVKPVNDVYHIPQIYKEHKFQEKTHKKFQEVHVGKVYYIFSIKQGSKKVIQNTEVINEIQTEIDKLRK